MKLLLLCVAGLLVACPRGSDPRTSGGVAPEGPPFETGQLHEDFTDAELMGILRELGYDPRPVLDGSVTFELGPAQVMLFNQWGGDLQLYYVVTGGDWALETINQWNRTRRLCRAYLDADGDLVLESDLLSLGGVTDRQVASFVAIFAKAVEMFIHEVAATGVTPAARPQTPDVDRGGTWH